MAETKETTTYNEKDLPSHTLMNWYLLFGFLQLVSHHGFRSLKEIRDAIPSHLFVRRLHLSVLYLARDFLLAITLGFLATLIDPYFKELVTSHVLNSWSAEICRFTMWAI